LQDNPSVAHITAFPVDAPARSRHGRYGTGAPARDAAAL